MSLKHDPLYKELIQALFKDFIQFALEDLHKVIDYRKVKFLDKEISDIFTGSNRRLDIFAEATIKNKKEIIYIHIEIESGKNLEFPFRMWDYFSQIHRKFKKPVIPIVLFVDDHQWTRKVIPNHYKVEFLGKEILRFNYTLIKPKSFKVEDFLNYDNPFVKALLVKMDLSNVDAKKIKLGIIRYLTANQKNLGKNGLMVYNFINTYCILTPTDEQELLNLTKEDPEVKQMTISWAEKISVKSREEGIEEGREKGREEGKIIEKINILTVLVKNYEKELIHLKRLFDKEELIEKVYKTFVSSVQSKISNSKKEIRLLKSKQTRLKKKQ